MKWYVFECGCRQRKSRPKQPTCQHLCRIHKVRLSHIETLCIDCGKFFKKNTKSRSTRCEVCQDKANLGKQLKWREKRKTPEFDYYGMTFEDIGREFGFSRQRAEQIFSIALKKFINNFKLIYPHTVECIREDLARGIFK